jgi:PKD repeat protein
MPGGRDRCVVRQGRARGTHRRHHYDQHEPDGIGTQWHREIRASIVELSGTSVHNGTLVTFTTDLGRLEPQEARTNNGQAVVTLHAGTESGIATVRAFSGGAQSVGDGGLPLVIGAAAAETMTVTATPAELPSTGGASTISATVIDLAGNRLVGVSVALTTTGGSLSVFDSVTDSAGTARSILTSTVAATVTATLRGGAAPIGGTVEVAIRTAPTISIVAPVGATAGSAATFTVTTSVAAGSPPISAVDIVFGDGSGAVSLGNLTGTTSVTHVYLTAGTFTATVTLVDASGERVSTSAVVRVVPAVLPSVNIVATPTTSTVDQVVSFTATVSGSTVPIERFDWTFGDGTAATTSGTVVNHVYTSAGTRIVEVTATTVEGVSGSSQLSMIVLPAVPLNVNISASPTTGTVDEVVVFTAAVSGSTVPIAQFVWTFGDGTTATTSGTSVSHVYTSAGTRTINVTATTVEGVSGSSQLSHVVEPTVFAVNLQFFPSSPTSGSAVTFTATVSPTTTVVNRYDWKFGDTSVATGSSNSIQHTYILPGGSTGDSFTVEVTAFKAIDGTTTSSQVVVFVRP